MRLRGLCGVVMVLTLVTAVTESAATTPFFVSDTAFGEETVIFQVDQRTGQLAPIVELSADLGEILSLAAASDNLLYAVAYNGDLLQITVNPPGVITLANIGPNFFTGMAISGGVLYAVDEGTDLLETVQLNPVVRSSVGLVHLDSPAGPVLDIEGGDLAEDAAGNWFLWSNATEALYRFDVTTAVAIPVDAGASGLGPKTGLAFDYQGGNALFASSRPLDTLFTLNPATGLPTTAVNFCLDCPAVYDHRFGDLASPRCTDVDRDGFAPEGGVCGPVDCNDNDPAIHPGAPERCNQIDDDCNGTADDEPAATSACPTDACTATVQCVAGVCVTTPIVCDDARPCTADSCDPVQGCRFVNQPDGFSCSDGNLCNGNETCAGGICTSGSALTCDDSNPCTVDSCDPTDGCRVTPVPGCCLTDADCTDTSACTINERCVDNACISDPLPCNDTNPCTEDTCNPASGCVHTALLDGTGCSDGEVCNGEEACAGGVCTSGAAPSCDDLDPCTADSCVNGTGCQHVPIAACCHTDTDCADADQCTVDERCTAQHTCTSSPRNCNDGNPCTTDGCSPASGCTNLPILSGGCDDGNPCTVGDVCTAGTCQGAPIDCSDGNLCNGRESCVAETGVCTLPAAQQLCTPGSTRSGTACAAEWFVDNPGNPEGSFSTSQVCRQGDPACDHDTDPTACTFNVAVCLRVPDPRLDPPCTPSDVAAYSLRLPSLSRDRTTAAALLAALGSLPGATIGGRRQRDVTFTPPVDAVQCTAPAPVIVPVGRKKSLRGRVTTAAGVRHNHVLRLKCVAP